jgi:hypothetical protein
MEITNDMRMVAGISVIELGFFHLELHKGWDRWEADWRAPSLSLSNIASP